MSFLALSWHLVPGRGKIVVVHIPLNCPLPNVDDRVKIDGQFYIVRGVELFRNLLDGKRKDFVGLVVR